MMLLSKQLLTLAADSHSGKQFTLRFSVFSQEQPGVAEYIQALTSSPRFAPQVAGRHRIAAKAAEYATAWPEWLHPSLSAYLQTKGIQHLYHHQLAALEAVRHHEDILVATPTASGKSLLYNLPVLNMLAQREAGHALYLFPLKALAQDQLRTLNQLLSALPAGSTDSSAVAAAIFDGDTSPYQRRKIKEQPPRILISNPEMLHLSLLPYHGGWAAFFQQLRFLVVDEAHVYRGVLGGHVAWLFRRLLRVAAAYGARPQYILLSATIGNPAELGKKLLGRPVRVIGQSGAPAASKEIILLNPWDSPAYTASQLLEAALKRGLRTIVYTQSRKMTELITMWTSTHLGPLAARLSSYRAGFLPEERREIEQKLASGQLLGVISTSALELGIDIGNLDICLLVGYPGSMMATWQRSGRVGRAQRDSVVVLIAQQDALDQYLMRNPEQFFHRPIESATLNPANDQIMAQQLHCAAAEMPVDLTEEMCQSGAVRQSLVELTARGVLLAADTGQRWYASRKFPQQLVNLRGGGSQLSIIDTKSGEILGEIDAGRALKECHPGAVYLHRMRTWLVDSLDLPGHQVTVSSQQPSYFTRAMISKNTQILERQQTSQVFRGRLSYGRLRVSEQVSGYQKRQNATQKLIAAIALELPEQVIETTGFWLEIPFAVQTHLEQEKLHFMGALHALEHGLIAMFPLLILCDRNDIGGISCPEHNQTSSPTIFVYDGHPGGVGLAEEAYGRFAEMLRQTDSMIRSCSCENGCPSCVHSPKCGSGNRPIDKIACLRLLELLLLPAAPNDFPEKNENEPCFVKDPPDSAQQLSAVEKNNMPPQHQQRSGRKILPSRFAVFDLETKFSAAEVGGWQHAERMGMSMGVIYDSQLDDCISYEEHDVEEMIAHLQQCELVVGFNNKGFDNRVLAAYGFDNCSQLPSLDLLEEVTAHLGYRLSLDRLVEHTLGAKKSASGLQALQWYKEGRLDAIRQYCRKDVELTRDLFYFVLDTGYCLFTNKAGMLVRLPLRLETAIATILRKGK